jgi:hypothetical protein
MEQIRRTLKESEALEKAILPKWRDGINNGFERTTG